MSLSNMVLLTGATLAATGGSNLTFANTGTTVTNGVNLTVPATADYRVRQQCTFKYKAPRIQTDGSYLRDSKSVSYNVPLILASGKTVNNVIRIEREVHPEMSAAAVLDLNKIAAQLLFDTDTDNFWTAGSTS